MTQPQVEPWIQVGAVLETRDGRRARVICTDRNGTKYPVVCLVQTGDEGIEQPLTYRRDGQHATACPNPLDLLPPKRIMYVSIYTRNNAGYGYNTRQEADKATPESVRRSACKRIEYREGEFDE